jgi:RNase P subunit RPR2
MLDKEEISYCVKCRKKTVTVETRQVKMSNGRPALEGKCKECGTKVFKILSAKGKQ